MPHRTARTAGTVSITQFLGSQARPEDSTGHNNTFQVEITDFRPRLNSHLFQEGPCLFLLEQVRKQFCCLSVSQAFERRLKLTGTQWGNAGVLSFNRRRLWWIYNLAGNVQWTQSELAYFQRSPLHNAKRPEHVATISTRLQINHDFGFSVFGWSGTHPYSNEAGTHCTHVARNDLVCCPQKAIDFHTRLGRSVIYNSGQLKPRQWGGTPEQSPLMLFSNSTSCCLQKATFPYNTAVLVSSHLKSAQWNSLQLKISSQHFILWAQLNSNGTLSTKNWIVARIGGIPLSLNLFSAFLQIVHCGDRKCIWKFAWNGRGFESDLGTSKISTVTVPMATT